MLITGTVENIKKVRWYLLFDTKWINVTVGDDPSEKPIRVISSHSQYEVRGEEENGNEDAPEREKGTRILHYSPSLAFSLLLETGSVYLTQTLKFSEQPKHCSVV
jgi:hypothetical protein